VLALMTDSEDAVAAARTHDDGRTGGLIGGGAGGGRGWLVGGVVGPGPRRPLGPERHFLRQRRVGGRQRQAQQKQRGIHAECNLEGARRIQSVESLPEWRRRATSRSTFFGNSSGR